MSFAFNTMIGQVTDVAMKNVGYRFYYLFIVSFYSYDYDKQKFPKDFPLRFATSQTLYSSTCSFLKLQSFLLKR
jgi:hypothetical protein